MNFSDPKTLALLFVAFLAFLWIVYYFGLDTKIKAIGH